jgi:hypothetical protein
VTRTADLSRPADRLGHRDRRVRVPMAPDSDAVARAYLCFGWNGGRTSPRRAPPPPLGLVGAPRQAHGRL